MENRGRLARHSQNPIARTIGKLCLGGDWACANGDLEALGDIASRLVNCTPELLHRDLEGLSTLCRSDPEQAAAAWVRVRSRVLGNVMPSA